jgi:hypothetical protein
MICKAVGSHEIKPPSLCVHTQMLCCTATASPPPSALLDRPGVTSMGGNPTSTVSLLATCSPFQYPNPHPQLSLLQCLGLVPHLRHSHAHALLPPSPERWSCLCPSTHLHGVVPTRVFSTQQQSSNARKARPEPDPRIPSPTREWVRIGAREQRDGVANRVLRVSWVGGPVDPLRFACKM